MIRRLAADAPPPRAPSESECRFCDITVADCLERMVENRQMVEVVTADF